MEKWGIGVFLQKRPKFVGGDQAIQRKKSSWEEGGSIKTGREKKVSKMLA